MTGAEHADAGTLAIDGVPLTHIDPHTTRELGIAAIYQQPALFPHLTVAENIALSLERGGSWRRIDPTARRGSAPRAARSNRRRARSGSAASATLTMPEQQVVEIAKAIGADARIVIMDEPTASLSEREVDAAVRRHRAPARRRRRHHLHFASARRDRGDCRSHHRAARRRDGRDPRTRATSTRADLIRMMVGRELDAVFPKREVPLGDTALDGARPVESRATGVRRRVALGPARRDSRDRRARRLRTHAAGRDHLRPDAGRRRRDRRSTAQPVRIHRPPRRSRSGSATCPKIAGSTASCSRCRSRPTRASRTCRGLAPRPDRPRGGARTRAARYVERPAHQDLVGGRRGRIALGRQSAEGGAGAMARRPTRRS